MAISDLIQIILLIVTIIGLAVGFYFTYRELSSSRKISRGEFLLHLDEMLQEHKQIHLNLRPGGKWEGNKGKPETSEEWAGVDAYMGFFERVKLLLDYHILDMDRFDHFYGYRVINIVANNAIKQEKLEKTPDEWRDFLALHQALMEYRKKNLENRSTN